MLSRFAIIGTASAQFFDFSMMPGIQMPPNTPSMPDFGMPPMPDFGMPQMPQMPDFGMPEMPSLFPTFDSWGYDEEPVCNLTEDDFLKDHEYMRLQLQGIAKAVFRGHYHTRTDILSDECFGTWMNDYHKELKEAFHYAKNDPFAVTAEQFKEVGSKLVDIHFKLRDVCQIQRLYDDANYWCLDHMDICSGDDFDWFNNIMEYGIPLAGNAFDLFKLVFWEDDSCYTDLQYIDEVNRVTEDIASTVSYFFGFDLAWNPSRKEPHFTREVVEDAIDAYWELAYPVEEDDMMFDDMVIEDDGFFM